MNTTNRDTDHDDFENERFNDEQELLDTGRNICSLKF